MNVEKISKEMDAFEKQFEDIDVRAKYMEDAMGNTIFAPRPRTRSMRSLVRWPMNTSWTCLLLSMMLVRLVLLRWLRPRNLSSRFSVGGVAK